MRRLIAPASERNKGPILSELVRILSQNNPSHFLEVASGTGQHVSHFAQALPHIRFSPSDLTEDNFFSICSWCDGLSNVDSPQVIDCSTPLTWEIPPSSIDIIFVANMCHISPFSATSGLFEGASKILSKIGKLIVYGPFMVDEEHTSTGNENFDKSLREQCPDWGYRDINDLVLLGEQTGLGLREKVEMPANNFLLVFSS